MILELFGFVLIVAAVGFLFFKATGYFAASDTSVMPTMHQVDACAHCKCGCSCAKCEMCGECGHCACCCTCAFCCSDKCQDCEMCAACGNCKTCGACICADAEVEMLVATVPSVEVAAAYVEPVKAKKAASTKKATSKKPPAKKAAPKATTKKAAPKKK